MVDIDALPELRAIEGLKARYCRMLDTKQWEGLRGLLADDFVGDTSESGGPLLEGADRFVAFVRRAIGTSVTVHHVQQPEIELTSPDAAQGIWAMQDVVRLTAGVTLHGFGHYLETYRKVDEQWLITSSKLTRLREHVQTPVFTLFISDRMRRALQRAARSRTR